MIPCKEICNAIFFALWILAILIALSQLQAYGQIPDAVCRVQAGPYGGTGTLVHVDSGVGYVLTCKHVVAGYSRASATFPTGHRSPAGPIVARGRKYDSAIFTIPAPPGIEPVPIAESPAAPGEILTMYGYGGGRLISWSSPVRGYKQLGGCDLVSVRIDLRIGAQSVSGDSGGPAVTPDGKLAGIISGGELAGPRGPELDAHGPYQRPLALLLREATAGQRIDRLIADSQEITDWAQSQTQYLPGGT